MSLLRKIFGDSPPPPAPEAPPMPEQVVQITSAALRIFTKALSVL